MMAFKSDQWEVRRQRRRFSTPKNRTGFYDHNSLVEKQRKKKEEERERAERKGSFQHEANSGI